VNLGRRAARSSAQPKEGQIIPERIQPAVAQGLTRIVGDSALRDSLRHKGFLRARVYTWDQTAGKVQDILQKVIAGTAEAT
jgi:hypothetical protein